ncbi:hypothetical protein [Methylocaldum sp.]|uniref:hypothetical protein n=1 Tax=Methylocaldum sp. TaxID=1969727 RepID=UPI002D53867A|nr:hypothetical protein [Methylocaldum sp.]HYE33956.1 hypothetical protein [Methylocaldum sp.]
MENEKDNFWLYIGGVIVAVALVLVMVKGSEHEKYATSAKAIAEDSTNASYR